jgi:hypothetical protein
MNAVIRPPKSLIPNASGAEKRWSKVGIGDAE